MAKLNSFRVPEKARAHAFGATYDAQPVEGANPKCSRKTYSFRPFRTRGLVACVCAGEKKPGH